MKGYKVHEWEVRFVVPTTIRQRIRAAAATHDVRVGDELRSTLTGTYRDPAVRQDLDAHDHAVTPARAADMRVQLDTDTMRAIETAAQAHGWSVRTEVRAVVCAIYREA